VKVGIITSLIIPTEAIGRRAAFEMYSPLRGALQLMQFSAVCVHSMLMILYAIVYLLIALIAAINTFQHRDI
jgi:Cu-processing system permease protein